MQNAHRIAAALAFSAAVTLSLLTVLGTAEDTTPRAGRPARAAREAPPDAPQGSLLIRDVPHFLKKPDFGGEACAAMYLQRLGQPVDQDYVFDSSGLDPMLARGCYTKELTAALRSIGFRPGAVFYRVAAAEAARHLASHWAALHKDLAAGVPSIVCMRRADAPGAGEGFRLVLGFDAKTDEVIYHDPDVARGAYRRMKRADLLARWPLKSEAKLWTLIRLRLEPGRLKAGRAARTFTAADYAQHMMVLRKKVPRKGFTVVIEHPFVVIGDETPEMVKRRSRGTVKWAADKLKEAYFTRDPAEILDVWLFKDDASYRTHTKEIFNYEPDTPYGYFSSSDKALVMNIRTGGGTLVHEIVHPFVAANFPACPAWFNEGLGSLYEQSGERGGKIVGYTNWRLAGLQKAIRAKRVPSFKTLCSTTTHQFYEEDKGNNYAQARYLCYWLQEHGLLRKYYRQFHAASRKDPTGYETLKAILRRDDKGMDKFKQEWETYVMKLRFP